MQEGETTTTLPGRKSEEATESKRDGMWSYPIPNLATFLGTLLQLPEAATYTGCALELRAKGAGYKATLYLSMGHALWLLQQVVLVGEQQKELVALRPLRGEREQMLASLMESEANVGRLREALTEERVKVTCRESERDETQRALDALRASLGDASAESLGAERHKNRLLETELEALRLVRESLDADLRTCRSERDEARQERDALALLRDDIRRGLAFFADRAGDHPLLRGCCQVFGLWCADEEVGTDEQLAALFDLLVAKWKGDSTESALRHDLALERQKNANLASAAQWNFKRKEAIRTCLMRMAHRVDQDAPEVAGVLRNIHTWVMAPSDPSPTEESDRIARIFIGVRADVQVKRATQLPERMVLEMPEGAGHSLVSTKGEETPSPAPPLAPPAPPPSAEEAHADHVRNRLHPPRLPGRAAPHADDRARLRRALVSQRAHGHLDLAHHGQYRRGGGPHGARHHGRHRQHLLAGGRSRHVPRAPHRPPHRPQGQRRRGFLRPRQGQARARLPGHRRRRLALQTTPRLGVHAPAGHLRIAPSGRAREGAPVTGLLPVPWVLVPDVTLALWDVTDAAKTHAGFAIARYRDGTHRRETERSLQALLEAGLRYERLAKVPEAERTSSPLEPEAGARATPTAEQHAALVLVYETASLYVIAAMAYATKGTGRAARDDAFYRLLKALDVITFYRCGPVVREDASQEGSNP